MRRDSELPRPFIEHRPELLLRQHAALLLRRQATATEVFGEVVGIIKPTTSYQNDIVSSIIG
jgi:hypothetical protein